jgi:predicted alpha/beta hydrolase family esterase
LFIHGLGGAAESTWGRLPEFLLSAVSPQGGAQAAYYSYPTSLLRLPFSRRPPKIQELADGLRTLLNYKFSSFSRVALVAHSLGGLIARRYVIEEVKSGRKPRAEKIALFAVPNNGAQLARAASLISWRHNQLAQLTRVSDLVESINEDWVKCKLDELVDTKYIIGTQDRVVDRFSAAGHWGNERSETIVGRGHIDIVKPTSADELSVQILRQFIFGSQDHAGELP